MARASDVFLKKEAADTAVAWLNIRGVKFKVASAMNQNYAKGLAKLQKKEAASADVTENDYIELIVDNILLDWKDLENDNGSPMKPTKENRIWLLETYTEIGKRILDFAADPSNFTSLEEVDAQLGN